MIKFKKVIAVVLSLSLFATMFASIGFTAGASDESSVSDGIHGDKIEKICQIFYSEFYTNSSDISSKTAKVKEEIFNWAKNTTVTTSDNLYSYYGIDIVNKTGIDGIDSPLKDIYLDANKKDKIYPSDITLTEAKPSGSQDFSYGTLFTLFLLELDEMINADSSTYAKYLEVDNTTLSTFATLIQALQNKNLAGIQNATYDFVKPTKTTSKRYSSPYYTLHENVAKSLSTASTGQTKAQTTLKSFKNFVYKFAFLSLEKEYWLTIASDKNVIHHDALGRSAVYKAIDELISTYSNRSVTQEEILQELSTAYDDYAGIKYIACCCIPLFDPTGVLLTQGTEASYKPLTLVASLLSGKMDDNTTATSKIGCIREIISETQKTKGSGSSKPNPPTQKTATEETTATTTVENIYTTFKDWYAKLNSITDNTWDTYWNNNFKSTLARLVNAYQVEAEVKTAKINAMKEMENTTTALCTKLALEASIFPVYLITNAEVLELDLGDFNAPEIDTETTGLATEIRNLYIQAILDIYPVESIEKIQSIKNDLLSKLSEIEKQNTTASETTEESSSQTSSKKPNKTPKSKQTVSVTKSSYTTTTNTVKIKASAKTKLTFTAVKKSKYYTVSKNGKIKFTKKAKKGTTYKIKVRITAKATKGYKKTTTIKTIKVKVK